MTPTSAHELLTAIELQHDFLEERASLYSDRRCTRAADRLDQLYLTVDADEDREMYDSLGDVVVGNFDDEPQDRMMRLLTTFALYDHGDAAQLLAFLDDIWKCLPDPHSPLPDKSVATAVTNGRAPWVQAVTDHDSGIEVIETAWTSGHLTLPQLRAALAAEEAWADRMASDAALIGLYHEAGMISNQPRPHGGPLTLYRAAAETELQRHSYGAWWTSSLGLAVSDFNSIGTGEIIRTDLSESSNEILSHRVYREQPRNRFGWYSRRSGGYSAFFDRILIDPTDVAISLVDPVWTRERYEDGYFKRPKLRAPIRYPRFAD